MGFKEQLKEDLEIFLDLEEFGEKFKVFQNFSSL